MENWRKYRNYRRYKNPDDSFTYIITVDYESVEVSEELYREYAASSRKMEYTEFDLKRDRVLQDKNGRVVLDENRLPITLPEREVSLDKLIEEDWDYPSATPLPEDVMIWNMEIEKLRRCLHSLNGGERDLIQALFFKNMTEREYSTKSGISQKTVNDRKHRILKKLKKHL